MGPERLTIAIPTYRRPLALGALLEDLHLQDCVPDRLVVVDGEGGSEEVRGAVQRSGWPGRIPTTLIRSTRANLPFQRNLAGRAARSQGALLFLDDDLRIPDTGSVGELLAALGDPTTVAATVQIFGIPPSPPPSAPARLWGAARQFPPGSLTPTGVRRAPCPAARFAAVDWLRGGVMAIRAQAFGALQTPGALLALAECGWGLGEDLILARLLARRGRLVVANRAQFVHPAEPNSVAYRRDPNSFGFACAYSRRLVNDFYRGGGPPTLGDRAALLRTYLGAGIHHAWRAATDTGSLDFVLGYARGAAAGVFAPPSARRLTPHVDWAREFARSLSQQECLA